MTWDQTPEGREWHHQYYLKNREKILEYHRDRKTDHTEYMREYRAKMKNKKKCKKYYDKNREKLLSKKREKYWDGRENCGNPITISEFEKLYGYNAGDLTGWEKWDVDRCIDVAAECAKYLSYRYRNACYDYTKTRNMAQMEAVERMMWQSPMALLVDVAMICEMIKEEYNIYV